MTSDQKVLVVAEHFQGEIISSTSKTINCASQISSQVDLLILSNDPSLNVEASKYDGINQVLVINDDLFEHSVASVMAPVIADIASPYDYILAPSTTFGKDLTPRVSALLNVSQITDIMEVIDKRTFKRPIYAGNAIETIEVNEGQKIIATVRPASFKDVGSSNSASITDMDLPSIDIPTHTRFKGIESEIKERPDLQVASIVISGGRGVGSAENFDILYQLADKLGASVGASRAAVDAGYVPNDMQVGQTGKIIAPDLYFAFGISGAIQHIAGIKDAGTIVAVNKDPDAPIFEIADIGIVADLFEFIPDLLSKLD
jgi:electron transfer flavoprotein alpha subunit